MPEEINNREQAERRGGLWAGIAFGLAFIWLIALGGCGGNSANSSSASSKKEPSPGTVVKNGTGMEFAYVPAGSFQMGTDKGSADGRERPVHQVTFARGFYMGRYEVTQAQWQKVMGENPSSSTAQDCGESCPVNDVSWNAAQEFVKKLNAMNDGYQYRLPSEAEWEYACRAGTTGEYAGDLASMAWYDKNSEDKIHPAGRKQPNAWGLYDMYGNVNEWVMDSSHENYNGAPTDGSAWLSGGDSKNRVWRGGDYREADAFSSSGSRNWSPADSDDYRHGLRVIAVSGS